MKKQLEKQPKRVIPAFATEAEEAEWWYKNATYMVNSYLPP